MTPELSKDEKILELFRLIDPNAQTAFIKLVKLLALGVTITIE